MLDYTHNAIDDLEQALGIGTKPLPVAAGWKITPGGEA